jgi:hypothetical protein
MQALEEQSKAAMDGRWNKKTTVNQGGIYHGNGSKEQHVGNQHSEHVEQELGSSHEEPGQGIFRHAHQRRSG